MLVTYLLYVRDRHTNILEKWFSSSPALSQTLYIVSMSNSNSDILFLSLSIDVNPPFILNRQTVRPRKNRNTKECRRFFFGEHMKESKEKKKAKKGKKRGIAV